MTSWDFPPYPQTALSESVLNFTIINFIGQSICHEGVKNSHFFEKENRRTKIREFCAILQPPHFQHITKTNLFSCGNHTKLFPSVFNTHPSKVQLSPAHYSTFSLQLFNFQPMKVQYSQNPSSTTGDSYINSYYIFVFSCFTHPDSKTKL